MGRLECLFQRHIGLAGAAPLGVAVLPAKTCKAALKITQTLGQVASAKVDLRSCRPFLAALQRAGPGILHEHPEYGYFDAIPSDMNNPTVVQPLLPWLRQGVVPFLVTCPIMHIPYPAHYILQIYVILRNEKLPPSVANLASLLPIITLQCLALTKARYHFPVHQCQQWWHPLVHGAKDTRILLSTASAGEDPFPSSRVLDATLSVLQCRSRSKMPQDPICQDFVTGVVQAIWDHTPHGRWLCEQPGCSMLGKAKHTVDSASHRWSCDREAWVMCVCRAALFQP